ncbi:MAG: SDR family oxidoreductase [Pacificimonas sp.]|jgi:cyclic-di-GMP-binding biofilm dispersal mediator protein|nr:SDR family oxidoreductase [Pacificimonas sp.]
MKRAVILGGSRGIGAATVRRLAADGWQVDFTYNGSKDAAAALADETGAAMAQVDSSDRQAIERYFETLGPIDAVIVSAGVAVAGNPLELAAEDVEAMIDLNIRGAYFAGVEAARQMNDNGRIVMIGSVSADNAVGPGSAPYSMTKAALQGAVRGFARDFGARGITANVVQPGPVDTDMNPADADFGKMLHNFMAIQRHAKAEEVAAMVAYLLSPEAAMVTGGTLDIDGGLSA